MVLKNNIALYLAQNNNIASLFLNLFRQLLALETSGGNGGGANAGGGDIRIPT